MTDPSADKTFRVEGVGCWCPGNRTLDAMRLDGHTKECAEARRGWRLNYEGLREMDRQRRVDEETGRQIREAATAVLSGG